jgi:acylphosphatase
VELVAEGPPSALDRLEVALRDGPPGARVDDVDTRRDPATGEFARFTIRSGSHPGD